MSSNHNTRRRFAGILFGSLVCLGLTSVASAQNGNFTQTPNAAISGHNTKTLSNVSVPDCMDACISERGFKCVSFDYDKANNKCDLSDKRAVDVGGLKTNYPGNPYDHYSLSDVIERSVLGSGIERSKPAKNVLAALATMNGPDSTHVETSLSGWASKYGVGIQQGDHVQGITMTSTGRIVLSYSRQDPSREPCKGMLAFSSPFDPNNPDKRLTWDYYCNQTDGPEGHPSNVQATGEVVIVGTHGGSRFYHVPANGRVQRLAHLDMTTGGRDASGVVFNHKDGRFYALNANGPVTRGTARTTICRTRPNVSLFDQSTRFDDCKYFNTYASGQGSNLIMQDDGTMYLVSAFSTYEDWPRGSWEAYGAFCSTETAGLGLLGFSQSVDFEDILMASTIDWNSGQANLVYEKNISRTQRAQSCVHQRPSFRFSGGVATIGDGELIGFWAGRQNPPVLTLTDTFEFSYQPLKLAPKKTYVANALIDCEVEDIDNEGTSSTITATYYNASNKQIGETSMKDISAFNCKTEWIDFKTNLPEKPEFVKISTNGSDGFMVDRIELELDGKTAKSYGANNDQGWCFSTEESDGQGSWAYAANGICVTHHTWSFSGASVAGNPYDIKLASAGNQAVTTWAVDIDCDVSNRILDEIHNEETSGTITVGFEDSSGRSLGSASLTGGEKGPLGCTDMKASVSVRGTASRIRFTTDSSDGAMLDEITVYKNGKEFRVLGDDDDKGWCLSTQESDAHGSWQGYTEGNTCRRSFTLPL